ncbi:MAG: S8 family serine peptidase [Acidobacteriota bacterium]
MKIRLLLFSHLIVISLGAPPLFVGQTSQSNQAYRVRKVYESAFKLSADAESIRAFLKELPRDGNYFVLEGDLLLTEQEVFEYVAERQESPGLGKREAGLSLNLIDGRKDIYEGAQRLNYAVDKASYPTEKHYQRVVDNMAQAAKSWQEACPECRVQFSHAIDQDASPSNGSDFTVRYHDAKEAYVAAAFFPHAGKKGRYLNIDPSYFTRQIDGEGILRHALGHILGYRHSEANRLKGCYYEGQTWLPLSAPETPSVMQYYCSGESKLAFNISRADAEAHRRVYAMDGATTDGVAQAPKILTVLFEGGDAGDNATAILSILNKLKLIKTDIHRVQKGETLESIYKEHLSITAAGKSITQLAAELNQKSTRELASLRIDDEITYPDISFAPHVYSRRLEEGSAVLKGIRTYWGHAVDREVRESSGLVRVFLRGYRLELELSPEQVNEVTMALNKSGRANIRWFSPSEKGKFFSSIDAKRYWDTYSVFPNEVTEGTQGALGALVNLPDVPQVLKQCNDRCPQIILIDTAVYLHPDIAPAIKDGGREPSPMPEIKNRKYVFHTAGFNPDSHHGTHLAGIIASQDDNVGLIGIHPAARIYSLDWGRYQTDQDELGQLMEEHENRGTFNIYVMATKWDYLNQPRDKYPLARKILDLRLLLVAAAGNTPTGGIELDKSSPQGPMNLGDWASVIVVTACRACDTPQAALLDDANYSNASVHLAAPGDDIPSTVADGKYASASGTSPATAFVAGVASAMVAAFPNYQWDARKVKVRLQVTARPFGNAFDDKVAAGILDAKLALLDPGKIWVKLNGLDYAAADEGFQWCTDIIRTRHANHRLIDLTSVYRLIKKDNRLWVYTKEGVSMPGEVKRLGPLDLTDEEVTKPLFKSRGGSPVSFSQIEDLLLPAPVRLIVSCR